MSVTFELSVVTPEKQVLALDADFVVAPGAEGYFGVLPGHSPMVTLLKAGELTLGQDDPERFAISSGYAEVLPDRVTILVERAIALNDINSQSVEEERREAETKLTKLSEHDPERVYWTKQRDYASACLEVFLKKRR